MYRRRFLTALAAAGATGIAHANDSLRFLLAQASPAQRRSPDVIFVPTPNDVVQKMLDLAKVTSKDVVYDLGCGDGRIVISAAKNYGARGVGIDINPERIQEARANARKAGVEALTRFELNDIFDADIREATVVAMYLLPDLNLRLRPKLFQDLKPGTRIVSHSFHMGDWKPDKELAVAGSRIYLWTIPLK